jgi:hypothetical protein
MALAPIHASLMSLRPQLFQFNCALVCLLLALATAPLAAQSPSWAGAPVRFHTTEVDDAVTRLKDRLNSGATKLEFDDVQGYLPALLEALKVPVSSQGLVFSKTSLQQFQIGPERPRAIYFNDDVYVGWSLKGRFIEIIATDAGQGPTFYTLDQVESGSPKIARDKSGYCLSCHASRRTGDVPGYLLRSVFPDVAGRPVVRAGSFETSDQSDFAERWGGWYVTGQHGSMRHMGNAISHGDPPELDREEGANRNTLDELVALDKFLSPHSDLVALMVLDHQTQMHNTLTAANYETREALHQSAEMNTTLGRNAEDLTDSARRRIDAAAEEIVERLLFCDEFRLTDPVSGTSGFAEEFTETGPSDPEGRSLREFDLKTRLFRYPCSYLIHSGAFAGLPEELLNRVVARIKRVLSGEERDEKFAHLSAEDRVNLLAILESTTTWFGAREAGAGTSIGASQR